MHKFSSVTLAVATAVVGAMVSNAQTSGTAHDHARMSAPGTSMSALLTGPLGSRAPSGTAQLSGATLQITWMGDAPGSVRPWLLRQGSCNQSGVTVGKSTLYAPLAIDATGASSGNAKLDVPLAADGSFFVAVYGAVGDSLPVVMACGALSDGVPKLRAPIAPDHSTMDHSAMNMGGKPTTSDTVSGMSGMDHSTMNMSGTTGTGTTALMAIHQRMMADPVIRERVQSDPVLQRMLNELPTEGLNPSPPNQPATGNAPTKSLTNAPTKATAKPKVKPTNVTKSPANTMPGMDHSKMPGMKKPPV